MLHENIREKTNLKCYHCGDQCSDRLIREQEKIFCCDGCALVHQLLQENNLCTYYELENNPGVSPRAQPFKGRYQFLDDPENEKKLIQFSDGDHSRISLHLPQIHCSSCVWLLEHLHRLNKGIISSRVDFLRKEITIEYDRALTSLRKVVETLSMTGYEPAMNFDDLNKKNAVNPNRQRIYKLTIAGFCFGNIMLLSFPEYFSIGDSSNAQMQNLFAYLILALSIPVVLYSGIEFYVSAFKGLRNRFLNIDAPITLAVFITFGRSLYEILTGTGAGYLDSMSGIIFFMLIGRHFQDLTHYNISFDRDFKSYFPISVTRITKNEEEEISLDQIRKSDQLLIRNGEIVPCDSILTSGSASIDYSFVNGESIPHEVKKNEIIYAGGRQTGGSITLKVSKEISQSYLTQLWNRSEFSKEKTYSESFIHSISRYFTLALLIVATISFIAWLPDGIDTSLNAFTAVLVVACPCTLLLSSTFTNGSVIRIFSKNKFYLKNHSALEELRRINAVVFDKTGTITTGRSSKIQFHGFLGEQEKILVASAVRHSNHPLSKSIFNTLKVSVFNEVSDYLEIPGNGIECSINTHVIRIGSGKFLKLVDHQSKNETRVYVQIDNDIRGYFNFSTEYRNQLKNVLEELRKQNELSLISGDHKVEEKELRSYFGTSAIMKFELSPEDKMEFLNQQQLRGKHTMMVGDGLNDSGALQKSNIGIAISDHVNNFTPACDGILSAVSFHLLPAFIRMSKIAHRIVIASFLLSLAYNAIGLYYATTAQLHPVIAAILMPVSSLTVILFTMAMSLIAAKKLKLQ